MTLGEKAGAFGPWRAHQVIDEIAKKIAGRAGELVLVSGVPAPRVLVVDDLLLLPGDWAAHYVRSTLDRMKDRLATAERRSTGTSSDSPKPSNGSSRRRRNSPHVRSCLRSAAVAG